MKKKLQLLLLVFVSMFTVHTYAQDLKKDYTHAPNGAPKQLDKEKLLNGELMESDLAAEVEKCATVDAMNALRKKYPQLGTDEDFEAWIAKKIEEKKSQRGINARVIYKIPYVIHIIHDGSEINTPGNVVGNNLSAEQVESQIKVINEDFRKLNPDRANNPEWDSVAADMEIEFVAALRHPDTGVPLAEPGINRVNRNDLGLPAPPYSIGVMQDVIKPATSWDWEKVMNIWVAPLPGGLYGYAQFPTQSGVGGLPTTGASNTDGVVVAPFTFGSKADDDGSFTTIDGQLGRTLTHELGHWVGLRHVWGDGPCDDDDYVDDTPRMASNSPFGTCNPTQNTCDDTLYGAAVDLKDMNANYMDYSADACMNLFTIGQKERLEAVFENSPGRSNLPYSDVIEPVDAEVGFFPNASAAFEGSGLDVEDGCTAYKDIEIQLYLLGDATGGAPSVRVEVGSESTATEGEDYEILTDNLEFTFTDGKADSKTILVRIFNDALLEGDETIIFKAVDFEANGSDALLTQKIYTYTIDNDDFEPSADNTPKYFVFEDFENGLPADLTQISIGPEVNLFTVGSEPTLLDGESLYPSFDGSSFAYYSAPAAWNIAYFPLMSFEGNSGSLSFDWTGEGEFINFFGTLFPFDYGSAGFINEDFTNAYAITPELFNSLDESVNESISIPSQFLNGNWYFYIDWYNDSSVAGDSPIAYDNIKLRMDREVEFETEVTGDGSAYVNIPAGATVHVYSKESAGKELIASIVNSSEHDYGCTKVEVDRAGAPFSYYKSSCPNEMAFGKTIYITPEYESEQALEVSLYYTVDEISMWEDATGLMAENLYVTHADSAIEMVEDPMNNAMFVEAMKKDYNNYGSSFTAKFTSNLGGGYGLVPPSSMGITNLEAVQNNEQIDITFDRIFPMSDVDYLVLEKSTDNVTWEEFKIFPNIDSSYSITDYQPMNGGNLYRVRAVEASCGSMVSNEAYVNFIQTNKTKVFPNPAVDQVNLIVSNGSIRGATSIGFYDEKGRLVMDENVSIPSNNGVYRQTYDVSGLSAGQYYIKVVGPNNSKVIATFVKVNQ